MDLELTITEEAEQEEILAAGEAAFAARQQPALPAQPDQQQQPSASSLPVEEGAPAEMQDDGSLPGEQGDPVEVQDDGDSSDDEHPPLLITNVRTETDPTIIARLEARCRLQRSTEEGTKAP
jgi:hypothetical protein